MADKFTALTLILRDLGISGEPLALIQRWVRMHARVNVDAHDHALACGQALATPVAQPMSVGDAARVFHQNSLKTGDLVGTELESPAWNILLAVFAETVAGERISVSSACYASGSATSTALRYIGRLENDGLIVRSPDPRDGRRSLVSIAPNKVEHLAGLIRTFCVGSPMNVDAS